jgi:hypothetical protein
MPNTPTPNYRQQELDRIKEQKTWADRYALKDMSLPEGVKRYHRYEVSRGIPEQEGYRIIPPKWGDAWVQQYNLPNQSYFAQDPRRLAKYHYFGMTAPDDWETPDWFNRDQYGEAFAYMQATQGDDWKQWKPFDKDDPSAIYLTSLSQPPKEFQLPGEVGQHEEIANLISKLTVGEDGLIRIEDLAPSEHDKLMEYMYGDEQREMSPFMQEGTWDQLETWQKWALSIYSPQPMEGRPEWTRAAGSVVPSAMAFLGGKMGSALVLGAVGSLIGGTAGTAVAGPIGTAVGLAAGAVLGGLAFYQSYTGEQIWGVNEILRVLDLPDEITEKIIGTILQAADGESQEVLQNLPAAWKAAEMTYESTLPFGNYFLNMMSGGFQLAETAFNSIGFDVEWSSGQYASWKAGEIWALERAVVEPLLIRGGLVAGAALDEARSMIISGVPVEEVYADFINRYGYSGNITDFIAQSVLDPSQAAPWVTNQVVGKIADAKGDAFLKLAVEGSKGALDVDILPPGIDWVYSKITDRPSSKGLFDTLNHYKQIMRQGVLPLDYWPEIVSPATVYDVNPDMFRDVGGQFTSILDKHATRTDTGVYTVDMNAINTEFRAYIENQLTSVAVDINNEQMKAIIDHTVEQVRNVALETVLNNPGQNDAELNTNINNAINEFVDDQIGMISVEGAEKRTKYYPELSEWQRSYAGLTEDGQYSELQPRRASNWFSKLTSLDPTSQAIISLDNLLTNTGGLLQAYADDPIGMARLIKTVAGADSLQAGQVIEAMIQSAATKTSAPLIKAFVENGLLDQMVANWEVTSPQRTLLNLLSEELGQKQGPMLELAVKDPDTVIQMVRNAVENNQNNRLKSVLADIDSGLINAENLKSRMEVFTGKNYVPFTSQMFQTEMMMQLHGFGEKFVVDHYGIKPKAWFFRLSSAMKTFQSLAVLGFNPLYAVYNYVNNLATRAAQGIFGMHTPGQIDLFWDRFGIKPAMLDVGMGMADPEGGTHRGGSALSAAMDAGDWISKLRKAGSKAAKLGIFSNLAAMIEVAESRQATTIGTEQMWSKVWKDGVGYQKMPAEVEATLRTINPRLPDQIYSLINQGLNMDEVVNNLYANAKFEGVESTMQRAIQDVFVNNPEKARDIIEKSGIKQELIDVLDGVQTRQEMINAFDYIYGRLDSIIEQALANDMIAIPEDVRNRIQAEGWSAMMPLWSELWSHFTARRMTDIVENQLTAQIADAHRSNEQYDAARAAWRSRISESDAQWKRTHNMMLATAKGMIDAIGTTDPNAQGYVNLMSNWMTDWDKFYVEKKKIFQEYFDTDAKGDRRKALWKDTQEKVAKLYDQHVVIENGQLTSMFEALGKVYEETSHRPATEVTAWGQDVIKAWEATSNEVKKFRETLRNTDLSPAEVRQAFENFNSQTFSKLVADQRNAIVNGALELAKIQPQDVARVDTTVDTTPVVTPEIASKQARILTAEYLKQALIERASKYGAYIATTDQRNALAGMLAQAYPDDGDRHMVQRYLFDADSTRDVPGAKVKAALDLFTSVDTEGKTVFVIPENIRVQMDGLLEAAYENAGQGSLYDGKPADNADPADKAKYNEKKIQKEAQQAEVDQQTTADASMTRDTFRTKLREAFNLTREQNMAVMALVDAHAEVWGAREGKTADQWYVENVGDIQNVDIKKVIKDKMRLGATELLDNGKRVVQAFKGADIVTAIHELGHVFSYDLDATEIETVAKWTGYDILATDLDTTQTNDAYVKAQEMFADGFVKYMANELAVDVAPPAMLNVFQKFGKWLTSIINSLSKEDQALYADISPEMKRVYDQLLFNQDTLDTLSIKKQLLQHAPTGDTTIAIGVDTHQNYSVQYKIVEAADLVASHETTFKPNPLYPQELRARFRDRPANQMQILKIIAEFNPDEILVDTKMTDAGTPIIGPDMVVESGNGRVIALKTMIKSNPELFTAYIDQLTTYLSDYGFNPDALEGMEYPVLVRTRLDDVDRVAFALDANADRTSGYSSVEQAYIDVRYWSNEMLANLKVGETQEISDAIQSPTNKDIINRFLENVPDNELMEMVDQDGNLSRQGLERIKNSLLAKVFDSEGGQRILQLFSESADPLVRNIERSIERSLGELAALDALIEEGRRPAEYSISDDLADAINAYLSVKDSGQTIEDWNNAISMFNEDRYIDVGLYDPNASEQTMEYKRNLYHYLVANRKSMKPLAEFLKRYAQSIIAQPEADQMGLLGEVARPSKESLAVQTMESLVRDGTSKSFLDQGKPGQTPTLFQTRVFDDVPPAGTPIPQYEGRMTEETYTETLKPLLEQMKHIALEDMTNGQAFSFDNLPEDVAIDVRDWTKTLSEQMAGAKLLSMRYGEMQRNRALLNYQERYGIDEYTQLVFPYQFWFTRTMGEWGKRMIEKPAWLMMYLRIRRHQERMEQEGIPSRLKGKFRIPAEWLPDFMGNAIYADPMGQIFPFEQFATPFEMLSRTGENVEYGAIQIVQQMVKDGLITASQAQQTIENRDDQYWLQAIAKAQTELEDQGELTGMNLASMMMTPAMWWTYPYHILKGTPEKLYPLPGTRTGQALSTLGGPLGVIGSIMALPEEAMREKFNLSKFGEWGDYYIDRMLANLTAEGAIDPNDAVVAMIERKGPAFDMAYQLVEKEWALKIPGSQTAMAIGEGKFGAVLYTLPTTLFPVGILPEGELIQRGLKVEYGKAWDSYKKGNPKALNEFFEEHPEYQARLALFDEPEERMRQFLVSEIWERWQTIDNRNKPLIVDQLGKNFEQAFLDTETRDYTAIDIESLAHWAQLLGGYVPDTTETSSVRSTPLFQQESLKVFSPEAIAQVEKFNQLRDEQYPNYKFLQTTYFELPETPKNVRKDFLEENPELKEYWEWKDEYYKNYPLVEKYQDEMKKRYENNDDIYTTMGAQDMPSTQQVAIKAISENEPALMMQMMFAYFSGQDVSGGARTMLRSMWEGMGYPEGNFDAWLNKLMGELLN